jgi:hypothetical protein
VNNVRSEEDYTTKEKAKNIQQWGEEFVVVELLHITQTVQHPTFEDLPTYMLKNNLCYYVNMLQSPLMTEQQPKDINVVKLDEGSPKNI